MFIAGWFPEARILGAAGVGAGGPVRDVDSGNIRGRGEGLLRVQRQSLPSDEDEPA